MEVKMKAVLFSNLPPYPRIVIDQVTDNGWTLDS
jgi:hypothetical protein